jgi:hypothetical protein
MKQVAFLIFFLIFTCFAKFHLPQNFSATFEIVNRNSKEKYFGLMTKEENSSVDIKAHVFTSEKDVLKYHNGRMINVHNINGEPIIQCIEKNDVPPMHEFKILVNEATPLGKSEISYDTLISSCDGEKWKISYGGELFVICQERKTKRIKSITSQSIHINILSFVTTKIPQIEVEMMKKCGNSLDSVNEKHYEKKTGKPWFQEKSTCLNEKLKDEKTCTNVNILKSQNEEEGKTCIFLHGIGNDKTEEPSDVYEDYWGNVHLNTPNCKIRKFIRTETKFRGWDNLELQKEFCKLALWGQNDTKIVKNKLLFVHSMGNLILSAAIKNGFCDIDKTSTFWYDLNGPMMGSQAASFLVNICNATGLQNKVYRYIAEVGGYCNVEHSLPYPAYNSLDVRRRLEFIELLGISKPRISGILCGISSYGLQSRYGIALYLLEKLVGFSDISDGMVAYSSCNLGLSSQFKPDFESDYYTSTINHADGTTRNGDGWWGTDRKPLAWIGSRKGK